MWDPSAFYHKILEIQIVIEWNLVDAQEKLFSSESNWNLHEMTMGDRVYADLVWHKSY